MVKLTHSLTVFLSEKHPDLIPLLLFGHLELFDAEIQDEYAEWLESKEKELT